MSVFKKWSAQSASDLATVRLCGKEAKGEKKQLLDMNAWYRSLHEEEEGKKTRPIKGRG